MRIRIEVSPGALIGGAVLVLVLPLRWLMGAALAAAVHELCHYGAIRLCGGDVIGIRIGTGGALMHTYPMSPMRELLCAAAGPAGSFSLILFARFAPAAALCGMIQGVFNLMPLYPLDGGRILRNGLEMLCPRNSFWFAARVMQGFGLGIVLYIIIRFGLWLMVPILILKLLPEKKPLQRSETRGTIDTD